MVPAPMSTPSVVMSILSESLKGSVKLYRCWDDRGRTYSVFKIKTTTTSTIAPMSTVSVVVSILFESLNWSSYLSNCNDAEMTERGTKVCLKTKTIKPQPRLRSHVLGNMSTPRALSNWIHWCWDHRVRTYSVFKIKATTSTLTESPSPPRPCQRWMLSCSSCLNHWRVLSNCMDVEMIEGCPILLCVLNQDNNLNHDWEVMLLL